MNAHWQHHERRGAALLIVLAALILTVTAISSLALRAATVSLARKQDRALQHADELALAAEAAIEHWLRTEASNVVLPPDVFSPEISILHQAWMLDGIAVELRITAWDQDGAMPLSAPTWPAALPESIRQFVAAADHEQLRVSSLEVIRETADAVPWSLYPLPGHTAPEWIGTTFVSSSTTESTLRELTRNADDQPALGALLACAPQRPEKSVRNRVLRLNVNTAPLPLLEAAMRDVGRGGLDAIRAARLDGRPATLGAAPDGEFPGQTPGMKVQFVSVSRSWAFRIDVAVGHVTRSWWLVIARDDNQWRVVDRHVIAE